MEWEIKPRQRKDEWINKIAEHVYPIQRKDEPGKRKDCRLEVARKEWMQERLRNDTVKLTQIMEAGFI